MQTVHSQARSTSILAAVRASLKCFVLIAFCFGCDGWQEDLRSRQSSGARRENRAQNQSAEVPSLNLEDSPALPAEIADCVSSLRSQTPNTVIRGLLEMGYDDFFVDLCTRTRAENDNNLEACQTMRTSRMKHSCLREVASRLGDANACPSSDLGASSSGHRDPLCLAWTTGLEALCEATRLGERRLCKALFHNKSLCAADALCVDAHERLSALVQERATHHEALPRGALKVRLNHRNAAHEEDAPSGDWVVPFGNALFLSRTGCREEFEIAVERGPQHLNLRGHLRYESNSNPESAPVIDLRDATWRDLRNPSSLRAFAFERHALGLDLPFDRTRGRRIHLRGTVVFRSLMASENGGEEVLELDVPLILADFEPAGSGCLGPSPGAR